MAYTQILKALHRSLRQTAAQLSVRKCRLIHTHGAVSTVSGLTLRRAAEAPSCAMPALSCFIQAQRRRAVSLDSSARNKSSPEDRSVSRYQSGSPKPSAAQKGKQGADTQVDCMIIYFPPCQSNYSICTEM